MRSTMVWRWSAAALLSAAAATMAYAQYGEDDEFSSASDLEEALDRVAPADLDQGEIHSVIVELIKTVGATLHAEHRTMQAELAELRGEVDSLRDEVRQLAAGRQP